MNIALVSSKGGHLGQVKLIFTDYTLEGHKAILITETEKKEDLGRKENSFLGKFTTYNFKKDHLFIYPWRYLSAIYVLSKIFKKEKIDIIITNGAQISIPAVIAAKTLRIKSIFLDTVIRVKTPNWSARACYLFSDIFLVQHKSMARKYGKKAKFRGRII